jgi:hypothetical protein
LCGVSTGSRSIGRVLGRRKDTEGGYMKISHYYIICVIVLFIVFTFFSFSFHSELSFDDIVELQPPTSFTRKQEIPKTNIETNVFDVLIQDYPIDSIAFSRSILTDKLLMIRLSYNNNLHSVLEDQWQMIRSLLKKHGTPTSVMEDTLQWSTSDLVINAELSKRIVSYYYLQHINEHHNLGNQAAKHLIL